MTHRRAATENTPPAQGSHHGATFAGSGLAHDQPVHFASRLRVGDLPRHP